MKEALRQVSGSMAGLALGHEKLMLDTEREEGDDPSQPPIDRCGHTYLLSTRHPKMSARPLLVLIP